MYSNGEKCRLALTLGWRYNLQYYLFLQTIYNVMYREYIYVQTCRKYKIKECLSTRLVGVYGTFPEVYASSILYFYELLIRPLRCKCVSGHPPACIFKGRVKWPLLSLFILRMLNGVCKVHPV